MSVLWGITLGKRKAERVDLTKLYGVSLGLSKNVRESLGMRIPVSIFVQDPFIAEEYGKQKKLGIEEIQLDWEPCLADGPTSSRVAVVDYNLNTNITVQPVKWDVETKTFLDADKPNNIFFHQVNVWAIIQNIIAFFEDPFVMGRPLPWGVNGNRLIVLPHACVMENAFYSRGGKCLLFGFFMCKDKPVYTCLSHDIVAHETGHAILDGIRPYYLNFSSVQTIAFHEFIADLTAILSALRTTKVRHAVAEISRGNLWNANVISDLGEEFAVKDQEARYGFANRHYLRSAKNKVTMKDIENQWIPHDCSEVLTGAMFHILAKITALRMKKEKESPKEALWKATQHVNRLAFRALDYCPPVDIQFADYAQAVIRANEIAYPVDTHGYVKIIKSIFERRGIDQLDPLEPPEAVELTWKYGLNSIASSRTAAYHFLNDNRERFDIPLNQDFEIVDIYYTDKVVGANRKLPREIVIEYVWTEPITLEGADFYELQGKRIPLLCGGTLVFEERGNILYWSRKVGTKPSRVEKEGNARINNVTSYVKMLIAAGRIKCVTPEVLDYMNPYQPAIAAVQDGNFLHLEITPEFLNPTKKPGGNN
jgi:hypothetical protein